MEEELIGNNQYRQMMNLQRDQSRQILGKIKIMKIVKKKQRVMQPLILFQVQIKELIMCSLEMKERWPIKDHLKASKSSLFIDEEDEFKIEEVDIMWKDKFLHKPFVPLPSLSDYLSSIIKVINIVVVLNVYRSLLRQIKTALRKKQVEEKEKETKEGEENKETITRSKLLKKNKIAELTQKGQIKN